MRIHRFVLTSLVVASSALVSLSACSIDPSPPETPVVGGASPTAVETSAASAPDTRSAAEVFSDLADKVGSAKLVKVYTEDDDPNKLLGRPNGYTSKVAFSDSRIAKKDVEFADSDAIERGGSVEVYSDADGAKQRAEYLQQIGKSSGLVNEYSYLRGPILVRVTGNLPPSKAKDYEDALG